MIRIATPDDAAEALAIYAPIVERWWSLALQSIADPPAEPIPFARL